MLLVSQSLTAQVYVDNYATASDGLPDTEDIRDAIAELDKNGDTLFFGPGFYDIGGPNPNNQFNPADDNIIFDFNNYDKLVIQGNNTVLLGREWGTVMKFVRCDDLQIHDIQIKWRKNEAPHSAGYVKVKTATYVDVKLEFPDIARHDLPADRIMEIYPYGPAPSRPAYSGYFFKNNGVPLTDKLGPDSLRVYVDPARIGAIDVNDRIVIAHKKHDMNVTDYYDCQGVTIDNMDIYGGGGLGIFGVGCSNISIDNVQIQPNASQGAFLSTTAASTRFFSCRGAFSITNSNFDNTGDDGTNIHTEYYHIDAIAGNQVTLSRAEGGNLAYYRRAKVGDTMELGANGNSLKAKTTLTVTAVDNSNSAIQIATLSGTVPSSVVVGDLAISTSAMPSSITINNLHCKANRGRGIILRSHNATITNSSFGFISGPGIQLGPQIDYFHEGPSAENITIDNCTFSRCNLGHASQSAMLEMIALLSVGNGASGDGIIKNVTVKNSRFWGGAAAYPNKNGISLASTSDITLENNTFDSDIEERILYDPATCDREVFVNANTFLPTTPYATHSIPGTIQAEDFDNGGESHAYFDLTEANLGGQYRTGEEVDIYVNGFPNHDIRHFQRNEWLTFSANVATAGNYQFAFRVGRRTLNLKFRVYDEAFNQIATIDVTPPDNGYYDYFSDCIPLTAGNHQYRFWVDHGGFSFDKITVTACGGSSIISGPSPKMAPDSGIQVSPNPFQDRLHIEIPEGSSRQVRMTDMQGRVVLAEEMQGNVLDVRELPSGMYLLEVGGEFWQKVVRE